MDADRIQTTGDKILAIINAPTLDKLLWAPFNFRINHSCEFIENIRTILIPHNCFLQKNTKWKWSKECQHSFNLAKWKLSILKVLTDYNLSLPTGMADDACILPRSCDSPYFVRWQWMSNSNCLSPILTSNKKNYAQVVKEWLSLIFGVKHFHWNCFGWKFTLITDQKPFLSS